MVLLGLSAAGVVVVLVAALAWSMRLDRRRSQVQTNVTEEEARENAGPLTRAILPWSRARERSESWFVQCLIANPQATGFHRARRWRCWPRTESRSRRLSLPRSRARARGRGGNRRSGGAEGGFCRSSACDAPAHASEIDAVLLGLEGESALRSRWHQLERRVQTAGRQWTGAILQRLVPSGADLLVGAFRDPDLGCVIAVGLGGHQAGLGETVASRLPPTTDVEADELIDSCDAVVTELDRFRAAASLDREARAT